MQSAALYIRSSKDRTDTSADAQRRALTELADSKGLAIAACFEDVVEAANDVKRPGFQALLHQIANPARQWQTLIVMDTARIARNVYLIEVFKEKCRCADIKIIYEKLPEVNGMIDVVVQQVVQAFDQMHSMMSREKGLAGMAENVKRGFRAGGRAPYGYRLRTIPTGAVREGKAVTKSKLEPNDDAPGISAYLKGRAAGLRATDLACRHNIKLGASGLVGVEWNALTYAGHTVWNAHAERSMADGGYDHGTKRRPRSEWQVTTNTHTALITDAEAETILARLENKKKTRMRSSDYLLSGLLYTPSGVAWHGNAGWYRAGTVNINAANLEHAVLAKVAEDLSSPAFIALMLKEAHKCGDDKAGAGELATAQKQLGKVNKKISRLTSLLAETTSPRPLLEKIEALEQERRDLENRTSELNSADAPRRTLAMLTEGDVRALLASIANNIEVGERGTIKALLRNQIKKITLEKGTEGGVKACFDYVIPVETGVNVASPRGFEPRYSP